MELSPNVKEVKFNNNIRSYGRAYLGGEEGGKMEINLKKGDVLNTIIHENLHLKDPNMAHGKVYKEAGKIEGNMSLPEMADLLMRTYVKSKNPEKKREYIYTTASSVISQIIK